MFAVHVYLTCSLNSVVLYGVVLPPVACRLGEGMMMLAPLAGPWSQIYPEITQTHGSYNLFQAWFLTN